MYCPGLQGVLGLTPCFLLSLQNASLILPRQQEHFTSMSAKKEVTSTGVSSRTQLNLKALLAEQQEQVARNKAAGQSRIEGGVKRPDKVWRPR